MDTDKTVQDVLSLLQSAGNTVASTAATAFPLLVQYKFAEGIAGAITAFILLALAVMFFRFSMDNFTKNHGAEELGLVQGVIAALGFLSGIVIINFAIPAMIAPQGAVILELIKKVSH